MKFTLKQYLANDLFEDFIEQIQEENILDILSVLKKKLVELLKEEEQLDNQKVDHYLKIVAIFEQFFRFIQAKKIDPTDLIGFKRLVDNNGMDHANEDEVEKGIEKILNTYNDNHFLNFKTIVERRFDDFKKWFFGKDKEDLKIVHDAIDFTLGYIQKYRQAVHVA